MPRVLLTKEDFEKLVSGGIVEQNGVQIALQDIGFYAMRQVISTAEIRSL